MKLFSILSCGSILCTLFAASPCWSADDATISTASLLEEMVDLSRLGELPKAEYTTVQFSSADKRSSIAGGKDWFANSDGFGWEPIPAVVRTLKGPNPETFVGTFVIAEIDGPGALVREWTASDNGRHPGMNGEIRMYLDGAEKPVFSGSAKDFLTLLYPTIANQEKMSVRGLTEGFHQRDAGYYPIPFAKSCRIEWTGGLRQVHFYHLEFRKYPPETKIQTFQIEDLDKHREKIIAVGSQLANPSTLSTPKGEKHALSATIDAKKEKTLFSATEHSGRITQLKLKIKADDLNQALRQTKLLISFDENSRPQVETPLGDLFAAAPGINPYNSIPMMVEPDGTMTCRFVMPFQSSVKIVAENRSDASVEISGELTLDSEYKWTDDSLHFYALWRVDHDLHPPGLQGSDIPFLFARGKGRFVGCSVHLMCPSPHINGNWWGEGDEKLYVDDDTQPSFFGTGTEDYFNYSWSSADLFEHAYFAQPRCDGPDTRGFVTNNRFHILDDVPFQKHFSFSIELLHNFILNGMTYARITYLYARPGLYTDQMPIKDDDLRTPKTMENWAPVHGDHTKGGQFVQFEDMGGAEGKIEEAVHLCMGKQLLFKPKQDGETIKLTFDSNVEGTQVVVLSMSMTPNSGICEVEMAGASNRFDLFTPYQTMIRNHFLTVEMKKGKNTIQIQSLGKNPKSGGMEIGADVLLLYPKK